MIAAQPVPNEMRKPTITCGSEAGSTTFRNNDVVTIGILGVLFDAVFRWVDRRYNWMGE